MAGKVMGGEKQMFPKIGDLVGGLEHFILFLMLGIIILIDYKVTNTFWGGSRVGCKTTHASKYMAEMLDDQLFCLSPNHGIFSCHDQMSSEQRHRHEICCGC